jgi:uncharacterized protein YggE
LDSGGEELISKKTGFISGFLVGLVVLVLIGIYLNTTTSQVTTPTPTPTPTLSLGGEIKELKVDGIGVIRLVPDEARIVITVTSDGASALEALEANSRDVASILKSLTNVTSLRTLHYSIEPIEKDGAKTYRATNSIIATCKVGDAGKIVRTAAKNASAIDMVLELTPSFYHRVYSTALNMSIKDAKDNLEVLAGELGINHPINIVNITVESATPIDEAASEGRVIVVIKATAC